MEFVDVINDRDEVVGKISKDEAHQKGLLHRTVIAEVLDSQGCWTLVKQSSDRQDAGQFVSPIGGHVESGESEDEAIKREAFEEYGLSGNYEIRLVGKKIFNREVKGRKENHLFVVYEIHSDQKPILNEESVDFERFTIEQLKSQLRNNPKKFGAAFYFVINSFYPQLITP